MVLQRQTHCGSIVRDPSDLRGTAFHDLWLEDGDVAPPSYSPADLSPSPKDSQLFPVTRTSSSSGEDAIAPIWPLGDMLHPPSHGHLPHLLQSVASLSLTKSAISLILAESLVFIRPPGQRWRPSLDPWPLTHSAEEPGKDGRVYGFVTVASPQPRYVQGLRVSLIGSQRLSTGSHGMWEDTEIFRREVYVDGGQSHAACGSVGGLGLLRRHSHVDEGLHLDKGLTTYEFSIRVPADSPVSDHAPLGRVQYQIEAVLEGSGGIFKGDLNARHGVCVVTNPHGSADDETALGFDQLVEMHIPYLGPGMLNITANEFIVGAPITFQFDIDSIPKNLSIYGIRAYMQQTTRLVAPNGDHSDHKGPRRYIVEDGARTGFARDGFAERARRGEIEGLPNGPLIVAGQRTGEFWTWNKVGRLPNDNEIRSTTLDGTKTSLRFSAKLVFEVIFNESGPGITDTTVKIATLLKKNVFIASCCCMLPYLALPNYSPNVPESEKRAVKWKPSGCVGCKCDELWDNLRADEIRRMRSGGVAASSGQQQQQQGGGGSTHLEEQPEDEDWEGMSFRGCRRQSAFLSAEQEHLSGASSCATEGSSTPASSLSAVGIEGGRRTSLVKAGESY